MTQRFAGFRLVFAVVALALWAGDAANAQVERTPTAENVVRNVKRTPSPDANPVVAPRRVSEAPVAASRGGARAARVGGTGGDSARAVDNGNDSAKQETFVSNTNCEDVLVNTNDLACCLKTCREDLYVCVMGDHGSCPSASSASKTPIQCFKEFKCCLETDCFQNCEPVCEPPCVGDTYTCIPGELECCTTGYTCCDVQQKCLAPATCIACSILDEPCDTAAECCDLGYECCDTGGTNKVCRPRESCGCTKVCDGEGFCCSFDNKCKEDGDCCAANTETCFARDNTDADRCCFIDKLDGTNKADGDCGDTKKTFGRWGWTNGPYNVVDKIGSTTTLDFWCGAAKCDTSKTDSFEVGVVTIEWPLEQLTGNIKVTATFNPVENRFWTMHLGCGTANTDPIDPTQPGVYAYNSGSEKYTVAPGQYEYFGTESTIEVNTLNDCEDLWVIVHTCGVKPSTV